MKKHLIIAALTALTAISATAQGYVVFASTKAAGVYFAPAGTLGNNTLTTGFLWGSAAAPAPLIGSTGNPKTSTASGDWNQILLDPNYQIARNVTGSTLVSVAVNNSGLAQAGWSYNGSVSFPLLGSTAGSTIKAYAIAWESIYSTPQAAAAAGGMLGWGNLINYVTAPDAGSAASTFALSGSQAFGVSPVPEPGTFALAGLGMATMLIARRRNK